MSRIVSLIPSATEIVCALGFESGLVGRSHECDYPAAVRDLPALTEPKFDLNGDSRQIDERVKQVLRDALSVYCVDEAKLNALMPDIIVTQAQCEVCAVSLKDVERVARECLDTPAQIVSLEPMRIADVLDDICRVAEALGVPDRGSEVILKLQARMDDIAHRAAELPVKPTVACVEWIDPLMAGGNWVPELVEMAGGTNLFGKAGAHSPWMHWDDLWAADPDVIVVLPCGFDIERTRQEMFALTRQPGWNTLRAIRGGSVYLTDGNQYFNRPGPRLVESLEILAEILHPDAFHFGHEGARLGALCLTIYTSQKSLYNTLFTIDIFLGIGMFPASSASLFVGRENELAQISALLSDPACRLLTLVGPGGIGKTRLAVEVASLHSHTHFIPLQPLASPDHIVSALASALGFQLYGGDPKQQLLDYLREKTWLLVMDNFEHLLDGVPLLSELLAAAPNVRLLVTSRERLSLVEEWALEVGGLPYPAHESDAEPYSAVELFVQQARRAKVGFSLTDQNRAAIVRICRLVAGMPLGIELSAVWVRALSCEAIGAEIERSLDILETPARNVEPRHRTMRATFEPTWARLTEAQRDVFMKLSVFRGGFTREAAAVVAGASLRTLSSLVDKLLLRVDESGRYDLHELLRQYAEERLLDAGEEADTAQCHCDYFLTLAEGAEAHAFGSGQIAWFDRLEAEWDNLRAALSWSLETEIGLRLAASLGGFFAERAHWNEGVDWLERGSRGKSGRIPFTAREGAPSRERKCGRSERPSCANLR